jgi:hypothetical protein
MLEMGWDWIKVGKKYRQHCKVSGQPAPSPKNFWECPEVAGQTVSSPRKTTSGYVHKLQGSLPCSSKKFWKCPEISGQPALRMTIYLQCWNKSVEFVLTHSIEVHFLDLPNVFCNVANIIHWASKIGEGLEVEALASILQDPW